MEGRGHMTITREIIKRRDSPVRDMILEWETERRRRGWKGK